MTVPTQVVVPPGCFPGGSFCVDIPAVGMGSVPGPAAQAQVARAWVTPPEDTFRGGLSFLKSSSLAETPPPASPPGQNRFARAKSA